MSSPRDFPLDAAPGSVPPVAPIGLLDPLWRVLRAAPLALAVLAATGCGGRGDAYRHFVSRPDLKPPAIVVTTPARGTSPGYIFVGPKKEVAQAGPMIVDDEGHLIWFDPLDTHGVADFRVQVYKGRQVLTWWRGRATKGVGDGYDVIVDDTYREIARVKAGNGLAADIHEFLITPRDTALITVYRRVPVDLSSVGGPREGKVFEGVVQELDIQTGRVLFEWHSLDHVGMDESYAKPPPARQGAAAAPYDYFHVNSIDEDAGGHLLVSARNTHAIYEIDRRTGKVLWRLGGKKSDFSMGPGTRFAWQHDARLLPGGRLSLFDNEADPPYAKQSRALVLRVDMANHRVEVARADTHPAGLLSGSQGDTQVLPDGHVFVGWGANPNFTEFDRNGNVIFDAHFKQGADSYRAYRLAWTGRPNDPPTLTLRSDLLGRTSAYVSWNGATGVETWQVVSGPDMSHLRGFVTAEKSGFETRIDLGRPTDEYVAVLARGAGAVLLGRSRAQKLSAG